MDLFSADKIDLLDNKSSAPFIKNIGNNAGNKKITDHRPNNKVLTTGEIWFLTKNS
jgi:hypothetical protein